MNETNNKAKKEKIILNLANLKMEFKWLIKAHSSEFKNHPIQANEKLTMEEWQVFKKDKLKYKSEFWKETEDEKLESRRYFYGADDL